MRATAVTVLALAGVAWGGSCGLAQRGQGLWEADAARYGWLSRLDAGKKATRRTGKPLMVVLRCVP
jgi:hypothetical protein